MPRRYKSGKELFFYLAVSLVVVSIALVREEDKVQKPVYFTSWALRDAEESYPPIEKLAFTLITTARKLKSYFQAHTVTVLTDKPLQRVMSSPEATGQMALWAIKLNNFDMQYRPYTTIKGQVIIDFNRACTQMNRPPDKQAKLVWYFVAHKGRRSNAWSDSISL